jgi:hypothetical protein
MYAREPMKMMILCLLFILLGCQQEKRGEDLYTKIYKNWIYAESIEQIYQSKEMITRPVGIEQLLFKIDFVEINGLRINSNCIYYRVPFRKMLGTLTIIENKELAPCPESKESLPERPLERIENLENLKIEFTNFNLKIIFKKNKELISWEFPLVNITNKTIHEKYHFERHPSKFEGLSLIRFNEDKIKSFSSKYIGKESDKYADRSAIACFRVSKNCELEGENICAQCRFGFYEVVSKNCKINGPKFCGLNQCGKKNEPACNRGMKTLDSDSDGICEEGLTPVFDADNILVCQ